MTMETTKLKKFAQYARRYLIEQVSAKLKLMLAKDSAARRENPKVVTELEKQIHKSSQEQVIEKVSYIWFNRFSALRFMDVNRYSRIGVVSPAERQFQPEILAEAKMGHMDEDMIPANTREQVFALLAGTIPSRDPQAEAYRLLVVAVCNNYHKMMPFLFERIADYTYLLMPDDLLSGNSILAYTREAMTPEVCQDVEVIGWLYQFYISEKKDDVFEGLKKNKKITPEDIPAATQLFTPHWIVRYLVENTLGRLWMLNRPHSRLVEQMDYYIKPEQPETDFLKISSPEEIKVCDPACGSGHMLVYAFDLLYGIYKEEGYEVSQIPEKILTHNLYGIEIDERAGELAAFALSIKARGKNRRFFRKPVQPNICVLKNVHFEQDELNAYMDEIGRDLFTANLKTTLSQFEEADNFGALIRPALTDAKYTLSLLEAKDVSGNLFLANTHERVFLAIKQADYLSRKYHVVIANPPYMGGKGMNGRLKYFAQENYPDSKADLFAMFIERGFDLISENGYSAMVTMQSWMFLSSYEKLRERLLDETTIKCMVHMANMVMGIAFGTTATVWNKVKNTDLKGHFSYVYYEDLTPDNKPKQFPMQNDRLARVSTAEFKKIPGSPIAYWVSNSLRKSFSSAPLREFAISKQGLATGDNDRFLRYWHEIEGNKLNLSISSIDLSRCSRKMWVPYSKGGAFRKWYGNNEYVVNWENGGDDIRNFKDEHGNERSRFRGAQFYFKPAITWSLTSSNAFGCRHRPAGYVFDINGMSLFPNNVVDISFILGLLNSVIVSEILRILNPTMAFQVGDISSIPVIDISPNARLAENSTISQLLIISQTDWDAYEISWDFTNFNLLQSNYRQVSLKATYSYLRVCWRQMTIEMHRLEEDNNRIFIEAYALQDELSPEVPIKEITLTCNPYYRYGGDKTEAELEALLLADTMKEFISYAVGCMFGRYALDKPGLILANQGETIDDYLQRIPEPTFPADADNVIPMLDGDWFADDISDRFRQFLKLTFGEEQYEENLNFLETAIGKDIRKYFLKDFYHDHVKRYKKRPIYWLFSSPKGSFNALIYMHRYRPDTVSVVLNNYLREYRTKLSSRKSHLEQVSISAAASQHDKTKALKEIENLNKIIAELADYEREVLYPLAAEKLELDLDDGVKVNYAKFGAALKKIPGLDVTQE